MPGGKAKPTNTQLLLIIAYSAPKWLQFRLYKLPQHCLLLRLGLHYCFVSDQVHDFQTNVLIASTCSFHPNGFTSSWNLKVRCTLGVHFTFQMLMEIQCKGAGQCLYEVNLLKQIRRMLSAQHQQFDPAALPLTAPRVPCRHLLRIRSTVECSAVLRDDFFPLQVYFKTIN